MHMRALALVVVLTAGLGVGPLPAQSPAANQAAPDPVRLLLDSVQQAVQSGSSADFMNLLAASADRSLAEAFVSTEIQPGATGAVLRERDRQPLRGTLPGNGYRLIVEVFAQYGSRARIATWRLDVRRVPSTAPADGDQTPAEWRIAEAARVTSVENLYQLALDPARQYDAHDLTIAAEDVEITLLSGSVFVADTDQGVTGVVLLGHGELHFHPRPEAEKGQVKIFCGSETLNERFTAAFVRVNPTDFDSLVPQERLEERPVDAREFRRADDVLHEDAPNSYGLDLGDLSPKSWSLLPPGGDLLADVHTRRFGTLTYAHSGAQPEDITLFDRRHKRNVALYPSQHALVTVGRSYNEDDLADYDVLDYDIDAAFTPDRQWIDGRARLRLKVRAASVNALTLRLANSLTVRSLVSDQFGRLFGLRIRGQNSFVVNLPATIPQGTELTLTIAYNGHLEAQPPDRETVSGQIRPPVQEEGPIVLPEPSFLYSTSSLWYPQNTVTDYAVARMRISVPAALGCVASGLMDGPPVIRPATADSEARKEYVFTSIQPVRYLAVIISRFVRSDTKTVVFAADDGADGPSPAGVSYGGLSVTVEANPRQVQRGRDLQDRAIDIARFYYSIVGDCPYPDFTLALVDNDLPGGHSPAYFAALDQPLPTSTLRWRNDPAAFNNYPEFFIAHELAHQWWGQAVGWRNYHEQWLSEGFAQYFAALYAQHHRGDEVFEGVLHQLRRWAIEDSEQGPISLGYRLGHIRGDSRVFRAVVYNKGAAVLHMLRELIGDEAFFRGIRRFYRVSRFRKAGTDEFQQAMEQETGRPLSRFFQQWIDGTSLPKLKFSYRVEKSAQGHEVVLHVEQVGEVFDVPLPVTLQYADQKAVDVIIPVTARTVDMRVALAGPLRGVQVDEDSTLAEVEKG
ncbi:MAG: M1 family aminopeptidase [Betaproteobacteria bacterium]